ncbi:hypothetical protein HDE_12606 [Halotydeus destructor]|nr:hypothetical protein HDE_12606 [Halotydeus destructor]
MQWSAFGVLFCACLVVTLNCSRVKDANSTVIYEDDDAGNSTTTVASKVVTAPVANVTSSSVSKEETLLHEAQNPLGAAVGRGLPGLGAGGGHPGLGVPFAFLNPLVLAELQRRQQLSQQQQGGRQGGYGNLGQRQHGDPRQIDPRLLGGNPFIPVGGGPLGLLHPALAGPGAYGGPGGPGYGISPGYNGGPANGYGISPAYNGGPTNGYGISPAYNGGPTPGNGFTPAYNGGQGYGNTPGYNGQYPGGNPLAGQNQAGLNAFGLPYNGNQGQQQTTPKRPRVTTEATPSEDYDENNNGGQDGQGSNDADNNENGNQDYDQSGQGDQNGGENQQQDPQNDPDLKQLQQLQGGNNNGGSSFPSDLFPPGILSQQDIREIEKGIQEQNRQEAAERNKQQRAQQQQQGQEEAGQGDEGAQGEGSGDGTADGTEEAQPENGQGHEEATEAPATAAPTIKPNLIVSPRQHLPVNNIPPNYRPNQNNYQPNRNDYGHNQRNRQPNVQFNDQDSYDGNNRRPPLPQIPLNDYNKFAQINPDSGVNGDRRQPINNAINHNGDRKHQDYERSRTQFDDEADHRGHGHDGGNSGHGQRSDYDDRRDRGRDNYRDNNRRHQVEDRRRDDYQPANNYNSNVRDRPVYASGVDYEPENGQGDQRSSYGHRDTGRPRLSSTVSYDRDQGAAKGNDEYRGYNTEGLPTLTTHAGHRDDTVGVRQTPRRSNPFLSG